MVGAPRWVLYANHCTLNPLLPICVVGGLQSALDGYSDALIERKLVRVRAFAHALRRYTSLNHLAQVNEIENRTDPAPPTYKPLLPVVDVTGCVLDCKFRRRKLS